MSLHVKDSFRNSTVGKSCYYFNRNPAETCSK